MSIPTSATEQPTCPRIAFGNLSFGLLPRDRFEPFDIQNFSSERAIEALIVSR